MRRLPLVAVLALLAALAVGAAVPASAEAAKPCWRQLLNDWYDGRIDRAYPISCYREAIRNLPADVKTYSSAQEDLERALQNAIQRNGGQAPPVVPASGEGRALPPADEEEDGTAGSGGGAPSDPDDGTPSPEDERGVLDLVQPQNADSIPIPLLVLAGVAMLLLAAAGAGFVARRIQERRLPVAPVVGSDDGTPPLGPPE